jgi:predicted PurR-regulated permease PerM
METSQKPREQESDTDTGAGSRGPHAPVFVYQGLTYRDLQRAVFLTFGLLILYQLAAPLTTLLLFFLLVFILSAVLNPIVARLQERGVPRILSAVGLAALLLTILGLLGWLAVPPLLDEVGQLFASSPEKLEALQRYYTDFTTRYPALGDYVPSPDQLAAQLQPTITRLVGQVGRYTVNVVVGVLSLFILMVLVIYTVAHPGPLVTGLLSATPERYRPRMESALRRIMEQLKNWAFGSLVLGVIIGLMTGIGLGVLGAATGHKIPYILLFSVIAGIGEMIPNLGPILSAVPPVLIAFTIDPMLGLYVLLLFVLIQQVENNLIVPLVMGQSLNLHPISVTFMVLVMGALFGLLGAIIAVPVCAIVKVCWEEFYVIPKNTDMDALQEIADDIVTQYPRAGIGHPAAEHPGDSAVADELKDDV